MKKQILITLAIILIAGFMLAQTIITDDYKCINLAANGEDSVVFKLPFYMGSEKPYAEGNITISIKPDTTDTAPTEEDSITVWYRTLQRDSSDTYFMNQADSFVVVSGLDWARGELYSYALTNTYGVCHGIVAFVRYDSETSGDSITCPIWRTGQ